MPKNGIFTIEFFFSFPGHFVTLLVTRNSNDKILGFFWGTEHQKTGKTEKKLKILNRMEGTFGSHL